MSVIEAMNRSWRERMERKANWPDDEGARMLKKLDLEIERKKRRKPYNIIEDRGSLAFWLFDCRSEYSVAKFGDGWGLYGRTGGGCWGYLSDKLVDDLVAAGDFIAENTTSVTGGLTPQGMQSLREAHAKSVLGMQP